MIQPFRCLRSRTVVLDRANIDTDQIIPARFLTTTGREDLGASCFYDWRYGASGTLTDHPLNGLDTATHKILIAGDNFGCGSSREHASWSLLGFGIRAVVSTGFGDIFRSNALKNGLLPVEVDSDTHQFLTGQPNLELTIDLLEQELRFEGETLAFETEPFARTCLLQGLEPLDILLEALPDIEGFERRSRL